METKYELKKPERSIKMGCGNEISDWDDRAVQDSLAGKNTGFDPKMLAEMMPEVERDIERLDKEFNEKWQEIEREFPKVEEFLEGKFEERTISMAPEEIWEPDKFERNGFGPFVQPVPDFEKILPEVKIEEKPEVKIVEGGRILEETDATTATNMKIYKPRAPEEIEQKIDQLEKGLTADFKDKITPEEKTIIKELEAAKDAEKMQKEWIQEGTKIHGYGHRIIIRSLNPTPEYPAILTPFSIAKWRTLYEECKERGKFVTPYAGGNWKEFFCVNLRVFYTHPDWVKEQHPGAYHELEKTDLWLRQAEIVKQAKEGEWKIKT